MQIFDVDWGRVHATSLKQLAPVMSTLVGKSHHDKSPQCVTTAMPCTDANARLYLSAQLNKFRYTVQYFPIQGFRLIVSR